METTPDASILVIEDNADLNLALCEILGSYGYRIRSAANGFEALDSIRAEKPDVILCDIMMPGMDGYTLLRHTRSDLALRTLPFIFLTARTSTADQRRAKEIGVEDYLTKPVDSNDLVAAIENALRRRKIMKEETQQRMDELRARIVGILQHEFRTPLTFVLGYAELLQSATSGLPENDELQMSAAAILDGGRRLERLIENFLLLAEVQDRILMPQDMTRINALDLWIEIAEAMHMQARDAGLDIQLSNDNADLCVSGDLDLLREALRRLMDNAIRYRRPASKHIWISVDTATTYVGFRIVDEGLGMDSARLQEFAVPFEQPERDKRTSTGAGLGLALVTHVARLHGGSLQIDSEAGKSSTFTLWVPAAAEVA
jgi:signal transduction histidine kinase